jgi:hypothetical protein
MNDVQHPTRFVPASGLQQVSVLRIIFPAQPTTCCTVEIPVSPLIIVQFIDKTRYVFTL